MPWTCSLSALYTRVACLVTGIIQFVHESCTQEWFHNFPTSQTTCAPVDRVYNFLVKARQIGYRLSTCTTAIAFAHCWPESIILPWNTLDRTGAQCADNMIKFRTCLLWLQLRHTALFDYSKVAKRSSHCFQSTSKGVFLGQNGTRTF